mgnify:CR=1 FL=1
MSSIFESLSDLSITAVQPPAPACPIVDLPLELLERITARLDYNDLYSLASTSKLFRKTYRLRAVLAKLERYSYCDTDSWDGELFCLTNARAGRFGWSPFLLILSDEPIQTNARGRQTLEAAAVSPTFAHFRRTSPTEEYHHPANEQETLA